MRLTCPNCGAQYEVPDDVIPLAGRDVQCSNCGNTWFQPHPETEAPADTEDALALPDEALPESATDLDDTPEFEEVEPPEMRFDDMPEADAEGDGLFDEAENDWDDELREEEAEDDAEGAGEPDTEDAQPDYAFETDPEEDAEEEDGQDAPDTPQRRTIDASVAEVLRQEAERETRARAAETGTGLETQTEMGLDEPDNASQRRALEAKARMRRLRGLPETDAPEIPADSPAQQGSRRDQLPDIEEINSTLRTGGGDSAAQAAAPGAPTEVKRRAGFRLGFGLVLLLALAAILAYSNTDRIAEAYPPAGPYLDSYVAGANQARVWLDTQVTALFLWLDQIAAGE